jgi:poly(3-hydroxybutyrate) depolymerase
MLDLPFSFSDTMKSLPKPENTSIYTLHEMQHAALAPVQMMAHMSKFWFHSPMNPLSYTPMGRQAAAASELVERLTKRYTKPVFGIEEVVCDYKPVKIEEETLEEQPFCRLLHFKKLGHTKKEPKLLIVAPMSGHFATLLRGTVWDLLPHADIYITDWTDARDVPIHEGDFDLTTYVDYVIHYLTVLGPGAHVMAVCQPSVPVMAATAIMNAAGDENAPRSMTLIGGPIDTREAPTQVNQLAKDKPIEWFEQNVISRVPANYPGFMRRVYPGFMQLTGFMQMNLDRHIDAHLKLFQHLVEGDGESAAQHRKFYNEYLSVMDITAEFYLQTVIEVFQKHSLPKGEFMYRGEAVDASAITETALLTLEGELDDISGVGQTYAAQKLCTSLPASMKKHHLQKGVGHYGIFNGRRYRDHVVPIIAEFLRKHDKR